MDHDYEEDAVNYDQSTVSNVSLNVDRRSLDVPVVLNDQRDEHHEQERGKLSKLERATVEGDHQVHCVGHKLRFTVDQVPHSWPDEHKYSYGEDDAQVEDSYAVVHLSCANFEEDGHQNGLDDQMRHSYQQVDMQVLNRKVEGVDEALHSQHVKDRLGHEVARFLTKVLSELGRCVSSFPITSLKIYQELWSLNQLVLVILCCLLDDLSVIA